MAHDISKEYARSLAFPNLPYLHFLIAIRNPLRRIRRWLRSFDGEALPAVASNEVPFTEELEKAGGHYRTHGWAFVEHIFTDDFHKTLIQQFPERRYLEPPPSIFKAYDIGFKWQYGRKEPKITTRHEVYKTLFECLRSDDFGKRITEFAKAKHPLSCRSFLVNRTYAGSLVIPHKDDPVPSPYTPYINMVFFIEGTGGVDSGELILARDNAYKDIVFVPPTIRNACLIYDTDAALYHGFRPVASGKYRLAVTASFVCTEYESPEASS